MKKVLLLLVCLFTLQTVVWADSDRDYWMTAQEAKEYGMIDEVLSRKPATL